MLEYIAQTLLKKKIRITKELSKKKGWKPTAIATNLQNELTIAANTIDQSILENEIH